MVQFKHFFVVAMTLFMACVLTTSCGSDSSEDDEPTTTGVGTYKVEVFLSGETDLFTPAVLFSGMNQDGGLVTLYDKDGTDYYGEYYLSGSETPFTEVSASSASNCLYFNTSLLLYNPYAQEGSVSVKCKGYFNGKLTKTSEKTFYITKSDVLLTASFDLTEGLNLITGGHE